MTIDKNGNCIANTLREIRNSTYKLDRKQDRKHQARKSYQKTEYDKPQTVET